VANFATGDTVLTSQVAPSVSTRLVANFANFATGTAGVVDTGGKFSTGINDTGVDTGGK
jgi:hypothetical protein